MDSKLKGYRIINPAQNANLLSKISFFFTIPMFLLSRRSDFKDTDVYGIMLNFSSKVVGSKLEMEWNIEKAKKRSSILRSLWRTYGLEYILLLCAFLAIEVTITLFIPTLIGKIVFYFSTTSGEISTRSVVAYSTLLIGTTLLRAFSIQIVIFVCKQQLLRIRTACTTLVYHKSLKLNSSLVQNSVGGKAVTMITKDFTLLDIGLITLNYFFAGIIRIIISTYLVYKEIGFFVFFGVALLLLFIAVQAILSSKVVPYRLKTALKTDRRIQLIQEILESIRVIKMYAWEAFFSKMVDELRRKEVRNIQSIVLFKVLSIAAGMFNSTLPLFACIITYVSFGNHISAEKAYTIASCFATLGIYVYYYIPSGFGLIAEAAAALRRFEKYLLQDEVIFIKLFEPVNEKDIGILLEDVTVNHGSQIILKNINLSIKAGVTLITGAVGTGKSTLLRTMLGEFGNMGTKQVFGKISYASQEPWIFPGTIRQNIIFNEVYNKSRYRTVLDACALTTDLEYFILGDKTILSDKGFNLSQGQKLRINLARAVYRSADIYLLDECLANVDLQVGRYIYNECIKKFLRNKVCVIVSYIHSFMNEVDEIILLRNARAECQMKEKSKTRCQTTKNEYIARFTPTIDTTSTKECNNVQESEEYSSLLVNHSACSDENIYQEAIEGESIKSHVYYKYILAGGFKILIALLVVLLAKQAAEIWINYCLRFWVDSEQTISKYISLYGSSSTQYEQALEDRNNVLKQYSVSLVLCVLLVLTKGFISIVFIYRASINIHRNLIKKVVDATLMYFDKTPVGNVINRFSRDINMIDEYLPVCAIHSFEVLLSIITVLIIVSSVNLWLLIPSATFGLLVLICRRLYLPSGRNIRRVEGAVQNPVIGHIQTTFAGLSTIRACGAQNLLQEEFEKHLDVYSSVLYMHHATVQAFRLYLEIVTVCYIAAVLICLLLLKNSISASTVGLAITQSYTLTGILQTFIIQSSETEMYMTSAERLFEYSKAESENKSGNLPTDKKSKGKIVFKNVSLRYSQSSNMVLKNISFNIEHGERVAIVGRTGCGKSSIILTLFRLYPYTGIISLDNIDIQTLAVHYLRSKISIIPQNPTLFSGTVRSNLDPNVQYTDKELWRTLEQVRMNKKISSLDQVISVTGMSLSIGEKQLICLARAILQNNSIVIFDEATAFVDAHTENYIQEIIKTVFTNKTIITIAHRLHTIMDYDKIIVVDAGSIIECGSPNNLLEMEDGVFYGMVNASELLQDKATLLK